MKEVKTMARKSYKELSKLKTFEERFEYLKLGDNNVGDDTFGSHRYLNQTLYKSPEWKRVRDEVIIRDFGRNLGLEGEEIGEGSKILIHHLNPITQEDIVNSNPCVFDPDNLICTDHSTHNAIHYGSITTVNRYVERQPGDTRLW